MDDDRGRTVQADGGMAREASRSRLEARLNPAVDRRQKSVGVAGIMDSGQASWPFL